MERDDIKTVYVENEHDVFEQQCCLWTSQGYALVSSSCNTIPVYHEPGTCRPCTIYTAILAIPDVLAVNADVRRPVKYLDNGYYEPQGVIRSIHKGKAVEWEGIFVGWYTEDDDNGTRLEALIELKNGHLVQKRSNEMYFLAETQEEESVIPPFVNNVVPLSFP